jgi:hypothetical protein
LFSLSLFNPAAAGRALILRSLLRYDDVHFIPRQLAARWLINRDNRPSAMKYKRNTVLSKEKWGTAIMQKVLYPFNIQWRVKQF